MGVKFVTLEFYNRVTDSRYSSIPGAYNSPLPKPFDMEDKIFKKKRGFLKKPNYRN